MGFREWLRQQEVENDSMNNNKSPIIPPAGTNKDNTSSSNSNSTEKLPPAPPSILKSNQRKQTPSYGSEKMESFEDNQRLVQVGTTKLDSALAKTRSSKEGSPRQKRVTIMAVKEP